MTQDILTLRESRTKLRDKIIERENGKRAQNQLKDYHFLSANLSRFMPHLPLEEHWDIYLNVLCTMMLRDFDVHLVSLADNLYNDSEKTVGSPKIYITCHLGFCKASISLLILKGVDKIALVVDQNTYIKQSAAIQAMHDKFKALKGIDYNIKIINVEKSGSVLEMIQLIKEGYSLFAYMDGNSGYKGVYNKERTIEIPFLNSTIVSRTGLSAISYFTKTPIVPFVSYYDENDFPVTEFLEEISFSGENISLYMENTTKQLYKVFEKYITKHYNQWESWFYFHKYLDEKILFDKDNSFTLEGITNEDFTSNNLGLFKINEDAFLFNKKEYQIYPITAEQFNKLNAIIL
ncbi:hypothetical protein [Flavobacterium sp. GT3R68]|uniref:LpxL/LpxP family acyltransferase n=1 Tax=Flavobacterium sp. GT3R68 TaxID=2594437 RepID=UPI000F85DD10|nr:hypothetical protein [Flavobacterium sp. GT3R68]RTY89354.1 hypothetical protein EKL32_23130 [Flavobacterium sp. GSN2]TRW93914.1 hypothetical protein FNW07_03105 [Flavobacterium sp. GT3R68]